MSCPCSGPEQAGCNAPQMSKREETTPPRKRKRSWQDRITNMKPRSTQFGTCENTASTRQHASRLTGENHSTGICIEEHPGQQQPMAKHDNLVATTDNRPQAAAEPTTAGGEREYRNHLLTVRDVAELLQVPVSWVYGRMRNRSSERLPGYRLGKYWRFREDEVLAWVAAQRKGSYAA